MRHLVSAVRRLEGFTHKLSLWGNRLSSLSLFLMMAFIAIDVIERYAFGHAIPGSIDVVMLAMVILVFPSFGIITHERGHVCSDIFYSRMQPGLRNIVDLFISLFSLLIFALITWQIGARAWQTYLNPPGITTPYFHLSQLPFLIVASLGCAIMSFEMLIILIGQLNTVLSTPSDSGGT